MQGKDGTAATIRVGKVKTGDTPSVVNVGTDRDAVFDFTIPAGGGTSKEGTPGTPGADGKSAFEIAVAHGYKGSEASWLESLKGKDGANGKDGAAGKSAYQTAVDNGFKGDEKAWLESMRGEKGKSAYDVALDDGFRGTQEEWLASLRGRNGSTGASGMSAYEIAKKNGFTGDEKAWLESLKGAKGEKGDPGSDGGGSHVKIGTVTTGDTPSVTNSGTDDNVVLDFVFPKTATVTKNVIDLTVPAASWKNKEFSFSNDLIKADSIVFLGLPTNTEIDMFKAVSQACISCVWQEGGYMTLCAMQTVPTIDIKLQLVVM